MNERKSKLTQFYDDPFAFVDNIDVSIKRVQLNIFLRFEKHRKTAFCLATFCLGAWMIFGFDSTPLQFLQVIQKGVLRGITDFPSLHAIYDLYYGKEMHYSAFVIYGFMFWFLSRHYHKNFNILKTRNIAYSISVTALSIAVFEFFWMYGFATFQNQPWVITPVMPQFRIHIQNLIFLIAGVFGVLYMWIESKKYDNRGNVTGTNYKFRFNKVAVLLVGLTFISIFVWVNYPFQVEMFTVETSEGIWSNSNKFPQTLYTIDVNPKDEVNAGVWFWKENNLIHGVNTLVKALMTLSFMYPFILRKVEP